MTQAIGVHGVGFSFDRGLRGETDGLKNGQGDRKAASARQPKDTYPY
jgi:hypothetical protein